MAFYKNKRWLIAALFSIVSISIANNTQALDNEKYQEKGDAIFRMFGAWPWEKHSGIYEEYVSDDPVDDVNHTIWHQDGSSVKRTTLQVFKAYTYYGAKTKGSISEETRRAIISTAEALEGKDYVDDAPTQCVILVDENDTRIDSIDDIDKIRCDGYVEYCYQANGINIGGMNIIENPNDYNGLLAYTPDMQFERMSNATIENPTKVTDLQSTTHNNAINQFNDPQSKNNKVTLTWEKATDEHSDINQYFIKWDEVPDTIPTFSDDIISSDATTLTSDELPDSNKHYFHIRSIDKAGNWDEDGSGEACTEHIGPFFIDATPPTIHCSANPKLFEVSLDEDDPNTPNSTTITITIEDPWSEKLEGMNSYDAKEVKCVIGTASNPIKTFMNNGTITLSWDEGKKAYVGSKSWSWDGTKDSGSKVSVGTYKIYGEAKDPAGNKGDNSGNDTVSADPTFIQRSRKAEVTVVAGSPNSQYKSYNYPSPQDISLNPSLPTNVSIYQSFSTDKEAEITLSEDSLSEDAIITINNTDKSDTKSQLVKAQYNAELSTYNEGIKSQVNTIINIDTQSYIDEAVSNGMDEQTVTDYINTTISTAQDSLNTTIDNLITTTNNSLLSTLETANTQITDKIDLVITDTLLKESQFTKDKEAAIQKAQAENNVDDLVAQLETNGASQDLINQVQQEAEEKAKSQAAIAISLLEAAKFNDIKTLHDEANLFIQNLVFDTNKTIISENSTLRQQILEEKDVAQSNAEKDIITYIRGTTDTILPTIQISSPTEAQNISGAVEVIGTASDENTKEYTLSYFDGTNWNTINSSTTSVTNSTLGTWNTNTVTNDSYPIKLRIVDNAGNVSRTTVNIVVNNQDLTAPVISITSPTPSEEVAGVITITGSITESYLSSYIVEYSTEEQSDNWIQIDSVHKVIDSSGILASFSPLLLPKGNHNLRITATDTNSNSSTQTVTINTGHKLNNTGGHLYAANTLADDRRLEFAYKSFDFKPNNLLLNQPSSIKLHYTDEELTDCDYEEGLLNIFLYNEETSTWELMPTQIDYENNSLTADITKLGVYAITEYKPDLVDTTLPIAEVTNSAYNSSTNIVTISGTANDENLDSYIVEYSPTDNPDNWMRVENSPKIIINDTLVAFEAEDLLPGDYSVRLTVYDQAGNSSQATSSFIIGEDKIINLSTSSDYIAPEVDSEDVPKEATITYQILQDANITIKIKDETTDIITLLDNQPQVAGIQQATWDGKDSSGQYVLAKTYQIEITSSTGTQASIPIEVKDLIAKISVPYENSLVRGWVPVFGLACGKDFKDYTVEYGEGKEPTVWTSIITSQTPQTEDVQYDDIASGDKTIYGNLATWETGLSNYTYGEWTIDLNGTHTLKLITTSNADKQEVYMVTVQVARVIANIYGGTAISPDGKIILTVPEQAIQDDFEVISILAIDNQTVAINSGYQLVGNIYEIEPPGERFSKDVTLEMNYTDTDLGSFDEAKLAIYAYNPSTLNWDYLVTNQDLVNNRLTTILTEVTSPYAYYAILAKVSTPDNPTLYNLPNANTQLQYVTISGIAGRGETVEVFVNGESRGTTQADKDTGYFSLSNILLDAGSNTITTISTDEFGQESASSDDITVIQGETPPLSITSVSFKDSSYSTNYSGSVYLGDALYIEAVGTDANANTLDATSISLKSSITDPTGITIQLLETDYTSGIYRATAYVSSFSDASGRKIAAQSNGETITITSLVDGLKTASLSIIDYVSPQTPIITSSTHPSICQNTFEDGFDEWSNRDSMVGATLDLNNTQTPNNTNCLELVNLEEGGNFASNIRITSFDASQYPLVSFDYKISEDVKINFLVKLENDDTWYEIVFTDDFKDYRQVNMECVGSIDNIIKDNNWHSTSFNLYEMLKTKTDDFQVKEMIMADWNTAGYMKLVYGTNPAYATYYLDNFMIIKHGFIHNDPQFTIQTNSDLSGIAGYSYVLDQIPNTEPDGTIDTIDNTVNFTDVADGIWYFHARAIDNADNVSETNHYKIIIDTQGPTADSADPTAYSHSADPIITLHLSDNQGTGVEPQTIKLKVEDVEYDINNPALSYDKQTETLKFTPSVLDIIYPNSHVIDVELLEVKDYTGNLLQTPISWEWIMDYSLDSIPPEFLEITSYCTHTLNEDLVTVCWQARDDNGIADYSFVLDQSPETMPDTVGEGLINSTTYSNLEEGIWYFHICAKDRAGNWSAPLHYRIDFSRTALLVDDFNDGQDPNCLGDSCGTWIANGGLITDEYTNDPALIYGDSGYSKQLSYDVTAENSEADWWTKLASHPDVSDYSHISLQVRGDSGSEIFKVGLKDVYSNEVKVSIANYLLGGVDTYYKTVTIPLTDFEGVDLTCLDSLNVTFRNDCGAPTAGIIYVDEIILLTKAGWNTVIIDLTSSTWKSAATNWEYTGTIVDLDDVKRLSIGVFAYINPGSVYIDNVRLTDSILNPTVWDEVESTEEWFAATTYSDATFVELSGEFATHGNYALKLNYVPSGNDKAFVDTGFIGENWENKRFLIFDIYSFGDITDVAIAISTGQEWVWYESKPQLLLKRPDAPVLDPISDLINENQLTITGKANPGVEIIPVVEIIGVGKFEQTHVFADEDGNFTAVVDLSGDGQKTIYCYVRDVSGVTSLISSAQQVVILDQNPPIIPTISDVESPRCSPEVTISGLAESSSTIYVKVTQPDCNTREYDTQAISGAYSVDITLEGDDGAYQVVTSSRDAAGNLSADSSPIQIVLDAINQSPVVSLISPNGAETIEDNDYDIQWQADDSDPTDILTIDIKYTDDYNQVLVDNFDDQDQVNSLGDDSGIWTSNGGTITLGYTNDPILTYGLAESVGKWSAAWWYSDTSSLNLSNEYIKQGKYAIKLNYNTPGDSKAFMEISDLYEDWSEKENLSFNLYNPSDVSYVAAAVSTGPNWDWHEFTQQALTSGWNDIDIDLTSSTWKSEATNWQYTGTIANLNDVKRLSIGIFSYTTAGSVYIDNILLDPTFTYLPKGHSLKLTYDITSASSEADWWTQLASHPDMSAYSHISLQVRGDSGSEIFKVGLKDVYSNEAKLLIAEYLPPGVTTSWQKVTIPLSDFSNVDISNLDSLNISFNNDYTTPLTGNVYIDEIRFLKWQDIATQETNDGIYSWDTSGFNTSEKYLVKALATDSRDLQAEDESDDYFSLLHNLAKAKSTYASSQQDQNTVPTNATDGDVNTRWVSESGIDPQWIYVDLNQEMTIRKVILRWESAYATSYQIQVSNDAINWTDVYSTIAGDGDVDEIEFNNPVSMRYVRMYGTVRATEWGYSLWEFEIY